MTGPHVDQVVASLLEHGSDHPMLVLAMLFLGSLVLEDLAIIAGGLFAAAGVIGSVEALIVLVCGITGGDLALHHVGRGLAETSWVRGRLACDLGLRAQRWIMRDWPKALFLARFTPGLRGPVYLASGILGLPSRRCALLILLASLLWVPALFLLTISGGRWAAQHLLDVLHMIALVIATIAISWSARSVFARHDRSPSARERRRSKPEHVR